MAPQPMPYRGFSPIRVMTPPPRKFWMKIMAMPRASSKMTDLPPLSKAGRLTV